MAWQAANNSIAMTCSTFWTTWMQKNINIFVHRVDLQTKQVLESFNQT
jgi:hypothetical protein